MRRYFLENKQKWTEPIDDHTFVRRVYLDAIGLPFLNKRSLLWQTIRLTKEKN
ncbi:MAG: hypothetical protein R3C61_17215 [Bacteroidia bacterium]